MMHQASIPCTCAHQRMVGLIHLVSMAGVVLVTSGDPTRQCPAVAAMDRRCGMGMMWARRSLVRQVPTGACRVIARAGVASRLVVGLGRHVPMITHMGGLFLAIHSPTLTPWRKGKSCRWPSHLRPCQQLGCLPQKRQLGGTVQVLTALTAGRRRILRPSGLAPSHGPRG